MASAVPGTMAERPQSASTATQTATAKTVAVASVSTLTPPRFTELNDLILEQVGGKIIFATDDWFAPAENLLKSKSPVWREDVFTDYGKWMDGWESRRKRTPGHDWCIIQLGAQGVISGFDIDTSYFTGNYAPQVSIQGAVLSDVMESRKHDRIGTAATVEELNAVAKYNSERWTDIVPQTVLQPGYKDSCHNYFEVESRKRWTHLRLNIYPDGGIARLRVYGRVVPDWARMPRDTLIDLAAMLNGGVCIGYSNVHFGHARNLIGPGRSKVMMDGWETARRLDRPTVLTVNTSGVLQVPGSEWATFQLGHPGVILRIEIDTAHFKGNCADSCYIEGCLSKDPSSDAPPTGPWQTLLPTMKLTPHKRHFFSGEDTNVLGPISHVRVTMAPDGGISRMRLWGYIRAPIPARL